MHYVFIHGEPSNSLAFASFLASSSFDGPVYAFDAPDHGLAADDPELDLAGWVRALERFVVALDGPATLVGHSLGAWTVARALPALGARVAKAVFLSGLPCVPFDTFAPYGELADAVEAGAVTLPALVDIAAPGWLSTKSDPAASRARILAMFERESMPRIARALRRLRQIEGDANTPARFDTPSVLVHARGDRAVPLALGHALAALAANARFVEIDDDGHFVHWDHPAIVRDAIVG